MSEALQTTIPEPTENTRLHLYVAAACPFCHRVFSGSSTDRLIQKCNLYMDE